jgi:hypothetical protein
MPLESGLGKGKGARQKNVEGFEPPTPRKRILEILVEILGKGQKTRQLPHYSMGLAHISHTGSPVYGQVHVG